MTPAQMGRNRSSLPLAANFASSRDGESPLATERGEKEEGFGGEMRGMSQKSDNGSGGGMEKSRQNAGGAGESIGDDVNDCRGRAPGTGLGSGSDVVSVLEPSRSGRGVISLAGPSMSDRSVFLYNDDADRIKLRRHYGGNWFCRLLYESNRLRMSLGRLVNNDRVQLLVVILIMVNAILMGIATFDFVSTSTDIQSMFEQVDNIFLIVFTAELGLQFLYHGMRLFLDGWLLFDFVVIVLSWAFAEAQIIRAFRIFRALRLVTRVRILRNLVTALSGVMPNMASIAMLLLLIMYIFCVMVTQLFKDMYDKKQLEYNYFGRLDRSFFTLFQIMTFDAWADVTRELMETYSWAWIIIIFYVIICGFIILNLIIAVICDAIATLHGDELAKLRGWGGEESNSFAEGEGVQEEGRTFLLRSTTNGENDSVEYPLGEDMDRDGLGCHSIRVRMGPEETQRRLRTMDDQLKASSRLQGQTASTVEYLIQQLQKVPSPER
uniref:Ion transport domain-containing protein n=1 Tax=Odontella aurita TaxID=265563 RepID=A0A7S4K6A5_9STRA|mmetsp:Transcript_62505/g.184877  ORF Transcript_62505/g.184877 Transcript_62505/m.184877 type:complete len:493 (+) Transcript_62505:92-1570(+)